MIYRDLYLRQELSTQKLKQTLDTAEAAQETHERQSKRINDENEHLLFFRLNN